LFFRQAIDEIIHDDIGHLDVFAGGVVDVIAPNGEGVTVATENEHVQIRPAQRNTAGEGQGASMNEVNTIGLDEIGETAGTADARDGGDLLVREVALFEQFVIESEDGKIAATGTPGRMVRGEFFLRDFARLFRRRSGLSVAGNFWNCTDCHNRKLLRINYSLRTPALTTA